jgi:hypothetical protein
MEFYVYERRETGSGAGEDRGQGKLGVWVYLSTQIVGAESRTPFTTLAFDVDHHIVENQGEGYA